MKISPRKVPKPDKLIVPPYKCFCCLDTGLVSLPESIYNDYFDGDMQIPMVCTRSKCEIGRRYYVAWHREDIEPEYMRREEYRANFDASLPAYLAEEMHQRAYQLWQKTMLVNLNKQRVEKIASKLIEQFS